MIELNNYYNMDCMQGMEQIQDNFFDLAIIDVPYGIKRFERRDLKNDRFAKYGNINIANNEIPTIQYFNELFRISKNQIIWGYNHLSELLPKCPNFIFWYKHNRDLSYAQGELAWTSFNKPTRVFEYQYTSVIGKDTDYNRIHPTQKPIALYKWLLNNYAQKGDKILDTHVGSASSLIACYDLGFEYVGFEKNENFYNLSLERLNAHKSQIRIEDLLND